jgi:hypothetical protein
VYSGSLTEVARIEASGRASAAPLGGAYQIAADDGGAAWTHSKATSVSVWPTAAAPHVACDGFDRVVLVALTPSYVYFRTASEYPAETGVIGRFPR